MIMEAGPSRTPLADQRAYAGGGTSRDPFVLVEDSSEEEENGRPKRKCTRPGKTPYAGARTSLGVPRPSKLSKRVQQRNALPSRQKSTSGLLRTSVGNSVSSVQEVSTPKSRPQRLQIEGPRRTFSKTPSGTRLLLGGPSTSTSPGGSVDSPLVIIDDETEKDFPLASPTSTIVSQEIQASRARLQKARSSSRAPAQNVASTEPVKSGRGAFGSHARRLGPDTPSTSSVMSPRKPMAGRRSQTPSGSQIFSPMTRTPSNWPSQVESNPASPTQSTSTHRLTASQLKHRVLLSQAAASQRSLDEYKFTTRKTPDASGSRRQSISQATPTPRTRIVRPPAGTYTISEMDAEAWPSSAGGMASPATRKRRAAELVRASLNASPIKRPALLPSSQSQASAAAPEEPREPTPPPDLLEQFANWDFEADASPPPEEPPQPGGSQASGQAPARPSQQAAQSPTKSLHLQSSPQKATADLDTPSASQQRRSERAAEREAARAAKAAEDARIQEMRRQQMAELENSDSDDDVELGNVDDIFKAAQEEESESEEESEKEEAELQTRRVTRSTKRAQGPSASQEKAKTKKIERPRDSRAIDELARAVKRQRRSGIGYAEEILQSIDRPESSRIDDGYPTPESMPDDDDEDEPADRDLLKKTLREMPEGAVDAEVMRLVDGDQERKEDKWVEFWHDDFERPLGKTSSEEYIDAAKDMPASWKEAMRAQDLDLLLLLIERELVVNSEQTVLKDECAAASLGGYLLSIGLEDSSKMDIALTILDRLLESHIVAHPFRGGVRACHTLFEVLMRVGANLSHNPEDPDEYVFTTIKADRTDVCIFICAICKSLLIHGRYCNSPTWLECTFARLYADESTSLELRRIIEETHTLMWKRAVVDLTPGETRDNPARVALTQYQDLIWRDPGGSKSLSYKLTSQVLASLGAGSVLSQNVKRWFAALCLVPNWSGRISGDMPIVPDIEWLDEAAVRVNNAIAAKEPNHEDIKHMVVYLHHAMSDMFQLVELCGDDAKEQVDSVRRIIIAAKNKIRINSLSGATSTAVGNQSRLDHLHMNMERVLDIALKMKERDKVDRMRGIEAGEGGQTRLAFEMMR